MNLHARLSLCLLASFLSVSIAIAGVDSSVSGVVMDPDQAAVAGARVQLQTSRGIPLKEAKTGQTGEFSFFPVDFGIYQVVVSAADLSEYHTTVQVSSGAPTRINVQLVSGKTKELVINVKEKKNLVQSTSGGSQKEISREQIATLPQSGDISLTKLLSSTTPGVVEGPFGQMYIRGNHANVQYQIDGVQLPDSSSGTFGDAFSPRNIDHMEVITGGIPAEYGERLAAVMNIITKAGPEKPGGNADVSYGSYNTLNPQGTFGGSNESGHFHYLGSLNYRQTDRGIETPEPASYGDQSQGGRDAVHDKSTANDEFIRLDDILDNENKLTLTAFNSSRFYQIPVHPDSFKYTDPYFQAGYTNNFGASNSDPTKTTFNFVPSNTNDTQMEQNSYLEFVWKHTFSERSFLQLAPYYKISALKVTNDPVNDLATSATGATPITGSQPSSFALDRVTNNAGFKADYTLRLNDQNLIKSGLQIQNSVSRTSKLSVQVDQSTPAFVDSGTDTGDLEAVYIQDSYSPLQKINFNVGLRYTATQFLADQVTSSDGLLQPRIAIEYNLSDATQFHIFYGKLFQPAPFENLRKAFSSVGGGQLTNYDVKAEKDDYYEAGIKQQIGERNVASIVYYYKAATDMMDDTQLLNTSIAQPYNFANGYASGIEFSFNGEIIPHLTDFFNYSYEDSRGRGISGGIFAFDPSSYPASNYQFLDHVQLNTANAGLTYAADQYWTTLTGLYGGGLRTGPNNTLSLPSHLSFDFTLGYKFKSSNEWLSGFKASLDILNLTDNAYPITIANGFNGSHYSAGREFFAHLGKEF
jgi:outer membrane cobalamin receptor